MCRGDIVKGALEVLGELSAAAAALLWFLSARIRLKERKLLRPGLDRGTDGLHALMLLVYEQSRWSAWAAIAAGLAALLALVDGLLPGT